ncbi:MAG TPA: PQQ-binding-like beta-propeller repeat protein [Hyphomonadaceae bacterium]|nr:PQQ-binding-like beta-propeller repeat protein [Hyphomonadaceae bacterium]
MKLKLSLAAAMVAVLAVAIGCSQLGAETDSSAATRQDPLARQVGEWVTWGADPGNTRYAALDQINASNVGQMEIAWRWRASDIEGRPDSNWKATPLMVDGVMYVPHGGTRVSAIDPGTGATIWTYEPDPYRKRIARQFSGSSRAVAYWTDGKAKRILHNTIDGRLLSIDAITGKADPAFGVNGQIDLNKDLLPPEDTRKPQDMNSTGPGIVVGDVIVIQMIGDDTIQRKGGTPGYIRGFDVRTGKKLWTFHTIPRPGEFGNETWENDSWKDFGAASVWSMMAADPELGMVYLPVESATNNFWGGDKPGNGLFGESIVALDAKTGKRVWHFQILHHGVWDYDLPAAPILHDVKKDGKTIKAITVLTKQGMDFVFDRKTGEPVWPIEERPVPTSMAVPGEKLSPTQPFPTRPAPYSRLGYHEEDLINFTPELFEQAKMMMAEYTKGPMYTPPTLVTATNKGTIVYPNYGGGSNWNGGGVDPETNTLFVPTRNTFMGLGLRKSDMSKTEWEYTAMSGGVLRLPNGLPVNRPPWALVTATDMNKGEHIWSRAVGGASDEIRNHPALKNVELDFDNMGQISVRPSPLVTKSLLFLASSGNIGGDPGDNKFWAYDKKTGKVISVFELPGLTSGAPMSYSFNGRQYIAVALAAQDQPAELVVLSLPGARQPSASGVAAAVPARSAEKVEATAAQLATGRDLFARSCAVCHGAKGEGIPGGSAPALANAPGLQDVKNIISGGAPEMPGFATTLSAEQIDAIARFVKVEFASPGPN